MSSHSNTTAVRRHWFAALVAIGAMVLASLTGWSSATAAVARPTNLTPSGDVSSSTPTLSWSRPSGAAKFEIEVDDDSGFGSPGFTATTTNTRAVPTALLATGEQHWRVRAFSSSGAASGWAVSAFTVSAIDAPSPISPIGQTLVQPEDPPLLSWTGTQGATSYVVEVDTEDDFVGAPAYTTSTTSLVVPDPLEARTYFWRVKAVNGPGVVSLPSSAVSFTVQSIESVTITGPADSPDTEVTDVVLDWRPVDGAQYYQLQVATDDAFQTIVDNKENAKVYGTKYSPAITYDNNQYYWRVRAVDLAGQPTAWTETIYNFNRVWKDRPEAVFPAGEGLQHVTGAPYFQWTPVTHATQYQLDVGTDGNWSPGTYVSCQIAGTTYTPGNFVVSGSGRAYEGCVMDPGTVMYWRVRPLDRPFTKPGVPGVQGIYSATQSFVYDATYFSGVSPVNGATVDVPTFRWNAVKGAAKYDITIKNGSGSNVKTATTYSTSYTPTAVNRLTAAAGPYTWTLRALDSTGVASVIEQRSFNVSGDIPTTGVAPLTALSGRITDAATTRAPSLTWEPYPGADHYKISIGIAGSGTFYTETAWSDDVLGLKLPYPAVTDTSSHFFLPGGYDWMVTAYNASGVMLAEGPVSTFRISDLAPIQGQELALNGQALDAGTTCAAEFCDGVPATPVLSWNPQSDVAFYILYISEDASFTNLVETTLPATTNTRYAFTMSNIRAALPESQAGSAYYWHVRPCKAPGVCAPDPVSTIGTASHTFRKQSPPVVLTGPASDSDPAVPNVSTNEVTFEWEDYFVTNQATTWSATGEKSPQAAMHYRIQVATSPTFSGATLIDNQLVDQTTYTAISKLYPEGTLHWRVQAIDAEGNGLAWSTPRSLVKESPQVVLEAPTAGQAVSGTAAFQWESRPFTGSYRIEVYKNNDTTFSTANRVFYKDVKTSAYAWDQPLPPSSVAYRWRVRRTDSSGNPGQWSSAGTFLSKGAVPTLTAPASGVWVSPNASLFSWGEVPGATTYKLEVRNDALPYNWKTITTAANAWAATEKIPDGSYKWRVTGIDAKRNTVGSSAWRSFRVDGTRPTVTSAIPMTTASAGTNIGVRFSERVAGVTTSTFKLTLRGSSTRIRGALRLNATRTAATFNPTLALKRRKTYRVTVTSGIKDIKGNALVGKTWTFTVR